MNKEGKSSCCSSEAVSCCSAEPKEKQLCPVCHIQAKSVLALTLDHLLTDESKLKIDCLDGFHFCQSPSCDVVYFKDDIQLSQKDITITVGLKEGATPDTVCYCFNWTQTAIKEELMDSGISTAGDDIKDKMNRLGCSCETLNPSGACCLGDVSKVIKKLKEDLNL